MINNNKKIIKSQRSIDDAISAFLKPCNKPFAGAEENETVCCQFFSRDEWDKALVNAVIDNLNERD